ncbi:MAG: YjbH domain-containing protein [Cyclobacteriaceae bacterium]
MIRTILLLLITLPFLAQSQYTLTGPRGMVNVPHAEVLEDETFMFGMHTNNEAYQLIEYGVDGPKGSEYISSLTIGFLDRVNLTLMLSRIFGDPKQMVGDKASIGDRSFQITYLIVRESKYFPSFVLNIADPFYSTNQFLTGNHILATKTFKTEGHEIKSTLGYGIPYLMVFAGQQNRTLAEKESPYLTHLFGGVSYQYLPANLQLSLEYDGWNINSGVGITFWERLSLQAYLQGMKHPGLGFNYVGTIH